MFDIEIELPYPPSVNHYWRRVGTRTLISREGRRFRDAVVAILAARRITPLLGPLEIAVDAFPPDKRRRDLDNLQKALFDSLQHGGAYVDDGQIVRIELERREPVPGGKSLVRIRKRPC